jgi:NTP pyrophosphatase (non-canonical NTP hydrolase)
MAEDKTETDQLEKNSTRFLKENATMYLDTYQYLAAKTAIYEGRGEMKGLVYCSLGLAGEAGELANKIKKIFARNEEMNKEALQKEIGDMLWYLSQMCYELGLGMQYVANQNLVKLMKRKKEGKLLGDGDDR